MHERPTAWRNLRHWTLHVVLSGAASFLFAYRDGWYNLQAVAGMLVGIAFFVALCTWVWNADWFHQLVPPGSAGRRALLYGTRVRSVLGLLGFLSVLLGDRADTFGRKLSIFFVPDLWAGIRACDLVTAVARVQSVRVLRFPGGAGLHDGNTFLGGIDSLVPTFFITVAEGLLLTVVLLAISGFCRVLIGVFARVRPTPQPAATAL